MVLCTDYEPQFQDQINSTDPLGSSNCTTYSGAMAGEYDTCGKKKPTGKRVRELTGDKSGGTTLLQVDHALDIGWDINLDTRIGSAKLTWKQFADKINAGRGAILQGSYSVIHGTKWAGDPNFTGNHAVYVHPGWIVYDPLADGRRPGIYKFKGEVYPQDLLKRFAGRLVLDYNKNRRLGEGFVWCSLTRDNQEQFQAKVPKKKFYHYFVVDGKITKRVFNTTSTGFTAKCTVPNTYSVKKGTALYKKIKSKRLVRLQEGHRKGWYITASWAQEI